MSFPASPAMGDTHIKDGKTWQYKGSDVWERVAADYEELTSNSNTTLDCSKFDSVRATWAINANYTLTFDNVVAGQAGDVVIIVTGECEVTVAEGGTRTLNYADSETYSFVDDKITLPAGRYHLCFTAGSDWMDFNIQKYDREVTT